jgi:hypothetical protein
MQAAKDAQQRQRFNAIVKRIVQAQHQDELNDQLVHAAAVGFTEQAAHALEGGAKIEIKKAV